MADNGKSSAWIQTFGIIAAAIIAGAFAIWPQFHKSTDSPIGSDGVTGSHENPGPVVMGQLEPGINRQGMDFSDNGTGAANAEICAELCRTNRDCKAMTYVISMKTCWLKSGVPQPFQPGGADYVSAVKR